MSSTYFFCCSRTNDLDMLSFISPHLREALVQEFCINHVKPSSMRDLEKIYVLQKIVKLTF
jgi:hypothetical protein